MSDPKFRRLRVLHLVSAEFNTAPNPLLFPLLTRGNRQRIESQVVSFVRGDARFAVVRQSGLPVHEVALSSKKFSPSAFFELKKIVAEFKPDVLHAWNSTAQLFASQLAGRGAKAIPIVWSVSRTVPLTKQDGWLGRLKFRFNLKLAANCKSIVYPSAAAAAQHRRAGLPEHLSRVISAGIDAERFKPDDAARQRVREQFELPKDAVLVGMYAPFQPEFDHATFIKAVGELIRLNPNLFCVLAGRGTVKGNSALSTMIGGGTLGTRTRIVGEWTDLGAFFNACDVVCSSALTDTARLTLAMSMLSGTMCVATGVGAQAEVLGSFGAAVEPGSIDAMTRGIRRILDMPAERKAFMAQAARNHILQNFNMVRSIEKYHELYNELVTGEVTAAPAVETKIPETPQSVAAAAIIAGRAAATSARLQPSAVQPVAEQPAPSSESATGFGAVESVGAPIKARAVESTSFADKGAAATTPVASPSTNSVANNLAQPEKAAASNDPLDFDAYVNAPAKPPVTVVVQPESTSQPTAPAPDHWTDDDAQLMDNILVEADPVTAKANADKAAAAAKAAAGKAAANAAFAAALSAGGGDAKALDPKMLAAALSLGVGNRGTSPRAVAGKPPPTPQENAQAIAQAANQLTAKSTTQSTAQATAKPTVSSIATPSVVSPSIKAIPKPTSQPVSQPLSQPTAQSKTENTEASHTSTQTGLKGIVSSGKSRQIGKVEST